MNIINNTFYKLRNKKDNTYLKGSNRGYAEFNKNGKAFNSIHHIKSSMNPNNSGGKLKDGITYDDLEIITYTVQITNIDKFVL